MSVKVVWVCGVTAVLLAACSGSDGAKGADALIRTAAAAPGAECPAGGTKVETGVDRNGNGTLDDAEVTGSTVVCNGTNGAVGPAGPTGPTGDAGPPGPPGDAGSLAAVQRIVFISSATYFTPDIASAAGADAKCNALAAAVPALANRSFAAWLSDAVSSPSTRFSKYGSFVRTDGAELAKSWGGLTTLSLEHAIDHDEHGNALADDGFGVWTGTKRDGTPTGANCSSWTSNVQGAQGTLGVEGVVDATWSAAGESGCAYQRHLYCFEQ